MKPREWETQSEGAPGRLRRERDIGGEGKKGKGSENKGKIESRPLCS